MANFSSHAVTLFQGNGDGTFEPGRSFGVQAAPVSVAVADLDADGFLDLATTSFEGVAVLHNQSFTEPDPRGVGFWKHQCGERGARQVSAEELDAFFTNVDTASAAFSECAQSGCDSLQDGTPRRWMRPKAERQVLALWLNIVSDRIHASTEIDLPDLTDALTVGEAIEDLETTLCDPLARRSDLGTVKDIAEAINQCGQEDR
jgi:hypothetical protein